MKIRDALIYLIRLSVVIFFTVIFVAGCQDSTVAIVKSQYIEAEQKTWEQFLAPAAGIHGNVLWESFPADNEPQNVRAVEAKITTLTDGKPQSARIQWLVNKNTRVTQLAYFEINGEAQSIYLGMMNLELWALKGSVRVN